VFVPDASWLNALTAADEMSFSIWIKRYDINASSAFWAASPSSNNSERGWQAHVPWSDNTIYFDTAGCCGADTQRINASITTLPSYTAVGDDSWWTNNWRHFVFSKKADVKQIWVDGELLTSGSNTSPLPTDITTLVLGGDNTITGNNMHGQIDDFAVFGTALAEADVKKLATGTAPTALAASTKIAAYWDFNAPDTTANTVTSGMVAHWGFDGNLQDSVKDFHGTGKGTNALAYADGKDGFGKALKLDGTDQYVDITGGNENELEFPGGSMSIAGWFKVDAFDTEWQALLAKGEGSNYRIARRAATGTIAYAGGVGEGADDIPAVNDGQWHHFVAISDATTNKFGTALYVDGILHGIMADKPVLTANDKHLFIGENPEALSRQFKGQLDDIAIWNRVLSADEVAVLYNGGTGTAISTLPQPAAAVKATIARSGANVTISWSPAGGTLESSPTLGAGATWSTVGTSNPATIAIGAGDLYYRVRQ
jgi:hypothetical protein